MGDLHCCRELPGFEFGPWFRRDSKHFQIWVSESKSREARDVLEAFCNER